MQASSCPWVFSGVLWVITYHYEWSPFLKFYMLVLDKDSLMYYAFRILSSQLLGVNGISLQLIYSLVHSMCLLIDFCLHWACRNSHHQTLICIFLLHRWFVTGKSMGCSRLTRTPVEYMTSFIITWGLKFWTLALYLIKSPTRWTCGG